MASIENSEKADQFLELIRKRNQGKLKIYLGMSAGVGKTYRMLQEAHLLLKNGVDVVIGMIETHGRAETVALVTGIPVIALKQVFYKGKPLEELDMQALLNRRPEVVLVDELAHTNIPGSKNAKRWLDVMDLISAGISVISAVNIQHLESLNTHIQQITGVEVTERIPDTILQQADEVVNIDLTASELIARLKDGKIYKAEKIDQALKHFFQQDALLQLRELALKEVARQVDRQIEESVPSPPAPSFQNLLLCISTNYVNGRKMIRKVARLASNSQSKWHVVYVQTPDEGVNQVKLSIQRHLYNNMGLAKELGAQIHTLKGKNVGQIVYDFAIQERISVIIMGQSNSSVWHKLLYGSTIDTLMSKISSRNIDFLILSTHES